MIDGFSRLVDQLVEKRIEDIITSEEYDVLMKGIFQELEQTLSSITSDQDVEDRNNIVEDLKSNIFQQVFYQSKLTYRVAFEDALSFYMETLPLRKKIKES